MKLTLTGNGNSNLCEFVKLQWNEARKSTYGIISKFRDSFLLGVAQSFVSEEEKELIYWATEMAPALKTRLITKKTRELTY